MQMYIMERVGWKPDATMKTVYLSVLSEERGKLIKELMSILKT